MKEIKINEWQEMALKKDTETIIKKLKAQDNMFYSMCWEIVITVFAVGADHIYEETTAIWLICIICGLLPPLYIIIKKLWNWRTDIHLVNSGVYDVKQHVDTFDNQICYWVTTCNSYCNLMAEGEEKTDSEIIFLYQEGCYYINKSIQALFKTYGVIDKVFTTKDQVIRNDNQVSVYRLMSIINMMKQYRSELDNQIKIKSLTQDEIVVNQKNVNEEYDKDMDRFCDRVSKLLTINIEWKKTDNITIGNNDNE